MIRVSQGMGFFSQAQATQLVTEIIFTIIIITLCILIYTRTKEMYQLSKYKGIKYFRITFLLFALTYLSRFLFVIIYLGYRLTETHLRLGFIMHYTTIIPLSILSTLALLYLAYSTIWKRLAYNQFIIFALAYAFVVTIVTTTLQSITSLILLQLPILLFAFIQLRKSKHAKKTKTQIKTTNNNIHTMYSLLAVFWILSFFVIRIPRIHITMILPLWAKIILQLLAIGSFAIIYYKVLKWVR